jgi:hypothetical protein
MFQYLTASTLIPLVGMKVGWLPITVLAGSDVTAATGGEAAEGAAAGSEDAAAVLWYLFSNLNIRSAISITLIAGSHQTDQLAHIPEPFYRVQ